MQLPITTALLVAAASAVAGLSPEGHVQVPLGPLRQDEYAAKASSSSSSPSSRKPNIIFILTDDQDLHMQSLDYLPLVKNHLIDRGTLYKRHFCTTAVCCPSRVSLWTGKQAHNTNVTDVRPPHGRSWQMSSGFSR